MFKTVKDFLHFINIKNIKYINIIDCKSSINCLFYCLVDDRQIVVKLYNKFWIEADSIVKENIKSSIKYNNFCSNLGVDCVTPWFDDLIFFANNYWQVFDFIKNENHEYSFLEIKSIANKMFTNNDFGFLEHRMLKLDNDQQCVCNKFDRLLATWIINDCNLDFDGVAHRDLRADNLIYNKKIYIIDFDFSGYRAKIVDDIAIALDLGLTEIPASLLDVYSMCSIKQALSVLIYEWRCWYNQLAFLSNKCHKSEMILYRQLNSLENFTIKQLENWFIV